MSQTVGDYLPQRLREWEVTHVFGYPGDGINGLLAAWAKAENEPQFVQARHEEMAAFEAVGFAKFSGTFGVCVATSGPGAIHLLNGLYDAKLDHVPGAWYSGRLVRQPTSGEWTLLAFESRNQAGLFGGMLSDPMPLRWRYGRLAVRT